MQEYALTQAKESQSPSEAKIDEKAAEEVVKHFAKFWRSGIDQITQSVHKSFQHGNTESGASAEILKQTLIQLVLYYERFRDILEKGFRSQPAFMRDLVPHQTILYEIKQVNKKSTDGQ